MHFRGVISSALQVAFLTDQVTSTLLYDLISRAANNLIP